MKISRYDFLICDSKLHKYWKRFINNWKKRISLQGQKLRWLNVNSGTLISFSLHLRLILLPKQIMLYFFSEEIHKSGDAILLFCQYSKYVLFLSHSDLWKSGDDINLRINFDNYLFFWAQGIFSSIRGMRIFSNNLSTQHLYFQ